MKKQHMFKDFKVHMQEKSNKPKRTTWENPLQCCICFEKLRKPKLLSCFHTFCATCLDTFLQRRSGTNFNCPLCLSDVELPTDGVPGLQNNVYVQAFDAIHTVNNPCQFCDTDAGVHSWCAECQENMCNHCKTKHQKSKATRDHKTVLLKDHEKKVMSLILKKSQCKVHPKEELRFLCRSCKELICHECSFDEHVGHKTAEISEVCKKKKKDSSSLVETLRAYLPYVKNNIAQADKETEQLKDHIEKTKVTIIDHACKLKEDIDRICYEKCEQAESVLIEHQKSIDRFKMDMERLYFSIKCLSEISEQIMEISPENHFIKINENLKTRLESVPREIPRCSLESARTLFTPSEIDFKDEYFGENVVSKVTILNFSPSDNKVPTFLCPGRPYTICPISPDEAWVVCDTPNSIPLYSKDGKISQILAMPGQVNDVYLQPGENTLLVTELRGQTIWKVDTDNVVTTLVNMEESVRGITGSNDKIFITQRSDEYQMTTILENTGDVIKEIAMENGRAIFGHPDRLAVIDGLTCVTDRGEEGSLIFVTESGRVMSIYKGHPKLQGRFEPWGVCADKKFVFVTDRFNDCIHLLDSKGSFLKLILTADDGVRHPLGVAVDREGHIWVGNEDGTVKVFKYVDLLP